MQKEAVLSQCGNEIRVIHGYDVAADKKAIGGQTVFVVKVRAFL